VGTTFCYVLYIDVTMWYFTFYTFYSDDVCVTLFSVLLDFDVIVDLLHTFYIR